MDILGMLPSFGGFFGALVAFVVALSIIVAIHEYGHYIVGRWCGIHAEVFSLGFGPVLYSRVDKRGTRWQLAAIPFGGYVKFMGDASAASAKDGEVMSSLSDAELKRTMHGADLWRRTATVAAGPVFNFILSIFVFAGVFFYSGVASDKPVIGTLPPLPGPVEMFQVGDQITRLGDVEITDMTSFYTAAKATEPAPTVTYEVLRDGETLSFESIYPYPAKIGSIRPRSAAIDGGLLVGDVIQAVDGVDIYAFGQLADIVQASEGKPLALSIWRDGATLEKTLEPRPRDIPTADGFEKRWLIGFSGGVFFDAPIEDLSLGDALMGGVRQTWFVITSSLSGLKNMATGAISSCNIQGPVGLAKASGDMASLGVIEFISFIGLLSTAIGFMNLFPIPVLDGGHLVFYAYEAVFRRPPNDKVMGYLMTGGLFLLLSLMVFASLNDFLCP